MGYEKEFKERYPKIEYGEIHHEIEQVVSDIYPGVEEYFTKKIDHISNLRGIPQKKLRILHKSILARLWNYYYTKNGKLLEKINTEIERRLKIKIANEKEEDFKERIGKAKEAVEDTVDRNYSLKSFIDKKNKLHDEDCSIDKESLNARKKQLKELDKRRKIVTKKRDELTKLGIKGYRKELIEKEKERLEKEMNLEREEAKKIKGGEYTASGKSIESKLLKRQDERMKLVKNEETRMRKRELLYKKLEKTVGKKEGSFSKIRVKVRGTMEKDLKKEDPQNKFREEKDRRHELNEEIRDLKIKALVNELESRFPEIEGFRNCKVKIEDYPIARMTFKGFSSKCPPEAEIKKFMAEMLEKEAFKIDIYLQERFRPNLECTYRKSKFRENKMVGFIRDVASQGKKGDEGYRGYTLENGDKLKQVYLSMDFDT